MKKLKEIDLKKKLRNIRKDMAAPAVVFSIGVMEDGEVDIIDAKAIHIAPKEAPEENESKGVVPDEDISDSSTYIG